MKKQLKVGLTGGLGSGKSYVSELFKTLGIPVFYADEESKKITLSDQTAAIEIRNTFGEDLYTPEGVLDKKEMANIVFNDEEQLKKLNAILHPRVLLAFENWCRQQNAPYVIKEAAILFESGSNKGLDFVITVSAPLELRIERATKRDGLTESQIRGRISKQISEEERLQRADAVIYNDGKQMLIPQIHHLHEKLIQLTMNN